MPLCLPQLEISTPTEPIPPGRGFYQLEEDALYVQIGPCTHERAFFSWLESDELRMEFERRGRLVFLEVALPRRRWTKSGALAFPAPTEMADVRWLDFRQRLEPVALITDNAAALLQIRFAETTPSRSFQIAERVAVQTDQDHRLISLWIDGIVDDLAGQEIAAFRRYCREHLANPADQGD
ncbi:MAG: hypothetical protein ABIE70_11635 [bacterium]